MRKETAVELWQLKTGLLALSSQLREGVDHLDDMTCKTIARALEEIMQETVSLPNRRLNLTIYLAVPAPKKSPHLSRPYW